MLLRYLPEEAKLITPGISMTKEEIIRLKQILTTSPEGLYYRPDEGSKPDKRDSWMRVSERHAFHHEFMSGQPLGKLLSFNYIRFADELPEPEKKEVPFESKDIKPRHMVFRHKGYPIKYYCVSWFSDKLVSFVDSLDSSAAQTYEQLANYWEYTTYPYPADPEVAWSPCKKVLGDK